ncbi:putative 2OG-Fe(II) oxygenase [Marinomonas colpomeniae]|uniref:2OG-Fe(II) oxygenase family protein n=1 Tax=Marinomonas colpomeniae TaxID=2774408 RepID=A0ABR8NVR3_9GAMM|nr:putative 2OG-Fe(II) oxygenase [Marinomonas colpomeniae]MBD5770138.1 2OG-Fe(II) oxygenase family protein [Marinomonas colpomeniae]
MNDNSIIEEINTWTTPFYVTQMPDHAFLKDALLAAVYQQKSLQTTAIESRIAPKAKHALHESTLEFLELADANIMEAKRVLEELVLEIAASVNKAFWPEDMEADAHIIESWYHVTQNGGYHDVHSHPNCSWCGIYYLSPGDSKEEGNGGLNRFYDPRVNAEHYADPGTAYLGGQGVWDFTPTEGQIIIFPSYLKHSALPYFGDTDRVVIAFNCIIEAY